METAFYGPWKNIAAMLPYINTVYADVKLFDRERHKQFCGVYNDTILENLLATNQAEGDFRLVVRVPVIPGINDSGEELERIGEFGRRLKKMDHMQLLPYHRLGTATYKKLGRPYLLEEVKSPSAEHMARCRELVGKYVDHVI